MKQRIKPVGTNGLAPNERIAASDLAYLRKLDQGFNQARALRAEAVQIHQQATQQIAEREQMAARLEGAYESYVQHYFELHGLDPAEDILDTNQGRIVRGGRKAAMEQGGEGAPAAPLDP